MDSWERADLPQAPKSAYSAKRVKSGKLACQSHPHQPPISCPECGSQKVWKDGLRYTVQGPVQRWLCRLCGFRFSKLPPNSQVKVNVSSKFIKVSDSAGKNVERPVLSPNMALKEAVDEKPLLLRENVGSHVSPLNGSVTESLNTLRFYNSKRRVCASEREAKNLAAAIQGEKQAAGATSEVKAGLVEFAWHLKKQGYKDATVENIVKLLKVMVKRGANLLDPESVKDVIARQSWSEGRKEFAVDAYTSFLSMLGLTWQPPRYKRIEKLPWIPTESEIDQLIAGCSHKIGAFLQLIKETGMRPGEALRLKWTDIDSVNRTVSITPEKGSNPRIFKVSAALMERLLSLPKNSAKVFGDTKFKTIQKNFQEQRKRIAAKLKNPRIQRITFLTLRHWKGTMEYHKTKDILHVMRILGHKNIKNTLVYTHLVNFNEDEFICRAAWTLEEAQKLIEAGFEYVCDMEGAKLFRRRK